MPACRTEVGKIEIRDSHTIVEVTAAAAPVIIEKLSGQVDERTPRDRASGSGSWGTHDVRNAGT